MRLPLVPALVALCACGPVCLSLHAADVETVPAAQALAPLPDFAGKGLAWLLEAQHPDGGWGAGSHANQQNIDPHAVVTDPATTAFVTMALMRIGTTPADGAHHTALRKSLTHLISVVDKSSEGPRVTELQGTQIQAKLGPLIDTAMTAQCLARALGVTPVDDPLYSDLKRANGLVIAKLEQAQNEQGNWGGGGWAPVLQSAAACTALELAQANGIAIDGVKLERARRWQAGLGQPAAAGAAAAAEPVVVGEVMALEAESSAAFVPVPATGVRLDRRVAGAVGGPADMAAGVELYAFSSAQRGNVVLAKRAEALVQEAKDKGTLDQDAEVTAESLQNLVESEDEAQQLAQSWTVNESQKARVLNDDRLLAGFGNNGGEEYMSFLMTSESLCLDGGKEFAAWQEKMAEQLPKAQNGDGSWSGHHCITSPVFCTAAVVQVMSVENDRDLLARVARIDAEQAQQ